MAYDPKLTPPNGKRQPTLGFGKIWRENDAVRNALGWATEGAVVVTVQIVQYSDGTFELSGWGKTFTFYPDGHADQS
jgi:hypothetical protein